MAPVDNSDCKPLEMSQDRLKLAFAWCVTCTGVALSIWLITLDAKDLRSWAFALLTSGYALFLAVRVAKPCRLSIGPAGLTFRQSFGSRHWRWDDLEDLRLNKSGVALIITMRSKTTPSPWAFAYPVAGMPGNVGLPGGWPIPTPKLFALLQEAKARWGTTPLAATLTA